MSDVTDTDGVGGGSWNHLTRRMKVIVFVRVYCLTSLSVVVVAVVVVIASRSVEFM